MMLYVFDSLMFKSLFIDMANEHLLSILMTFKFHEIRKMIIVSIEYDQAYKPIIFIETNKRNE